MKRKAYTIFVMVGMALLGVLYWVDLSFFINESTGLADQFPLWPRYLVVVFVVVLAVLGLRGVSPYAVGLLRVKSNLLSVLFLLAGAFGLLYGVFSVGKAWQTNTQILAEVEDNMSLSIEMWYSLVLGISYIWYGIWMVLVGRQMMKQDRPSPTKSAFPGMLAAMPFCLQTIYRSVLNPNSVYRMGNLVDIFSALFSMLWFGMLLRALYIALVHKRVRWMYLFGLLVFLFSTCLQGVQLAYEMSYSGFSIVLFLEMMNVGMLGIVTGCISLEIAGREALQPKKLIVKLKDFPKDPYRF